MIRNQFILIVALFAFTMCNNKEKPINEMSYEDYPVYYGGDLGVQYTSDSTSFKMWSPVAENVVLNIYNDGEGGKPISSSPMNKEASGLWSLVVNEDLEGRFYTYQVTTQNQTLGETPGIYAKAVGVNGERGAIVDFSKSNPEGWAKDKRPAFEKANDAVIYELHVRDITSNPNSGSSYPGKFVGLVEPYAKSPEGVSTGIDHIKELGVTHVHILPAFDFKSVDERLNEKKRGYNWGYDPLNYNVPEGSYATDPFDPYNRIMEFKKMVQGFHNAGIRVVMDVVYNHTGNTEQSNFNLEVPGYYYRHNEDGSFSDASACGNETASERVMMRKYMVESVLYWAKEYHVDGFRFDLMGIHDLETMNEISKSLKNIDPSILIYGEGWAASSSPLPDSVRALKKNTSKMNGVAAFSDDIRDGIKGSVFDEMSRGFVSGAEDSRQSVMFGVIGAVRHPQVSMSKVNYSDNAWAAGPDQCVNYVSCHDNQTLYDKLEMSTSELGTSVGDIIDMDKLANAIVLTSQGIPFIQAGSEMLRTKGGEHNSYNMPDSVNQIDWTWKTKNEDVVEYYKYLIRLRKEHPAFRMQTEEQIQENLHFMDVNNPQVIVYQLDGKAVQDSWKNILVVYNAQNETFKLDLPNGQWRQIVSGDTFDFEGSRQVANTVEIPPISMAIYSML